jgi:hypothetical protein
LREKLEARILKQSPNHDLSTPFSTSHIINAAEYIFKSDRFDADDSEKDKTFSSAKEDSDDSDSDSDSDIDSDREVIHYRRTSSKPVKTQKKGSKSKAEEKKRDVERKDTVEELFEKLSRLNLNDPQYPILYYKAITLDPKVETFLSKPVMRTSPRP